MSPDEIAGTLNAPLIPICSLYLLFILKSTLGNIDYNQINSFFEVEDIKSFGNRITVMLRQLRITVHLL